MMVSAAARAAGLLCALRKYPLTSYFAIALLFSWAVVLGVLAAGLPMTFWTVVAITLGPCVAGFLMTAVVEGSDGVRRLLKRLVLWRVPLVWYLFVLLGIPLIFVLGTVFLPGALASFNPLTGEIWAKYLWLFPLVILVGGPLLEEPGWRGFALARLQHRFGPLLGTIILGFLHSAWHYPQYMIPTWAAQNGGFNRPAVAIYTLSVLPLTVILTWVFNNTRGSLLLAILCRASINTFSVYIVQLFPAQAASQLNAFLGFGTAAVVIILLTGWRLGYDKYRRETSEAQPSNDSEGQEFESLRERQLPPAIDGPQVQASCRDQS